MNYIRPPLRGCQGFREGSIGCHVQWGRGPAGHVSRSNRPESLPRPLLLLNALCLQHNPIPLAASPTPWSFSYQQRLDLWPFYIPLWLVALLLLVTAVAVVYAARAPQRKGLASGRVSSTLAALRIALLGLIFILALKPALAFVHTTTSAGTLWLLVDHSRSMQLTDPQATPIERLRWAAALGYLSNDKIRPGQPDLSLARLQMLRQTLPTFAIPGQLPPVPGDAGGSGAEQATQIAAYLKQLADWQHRAQLTRQALAADPALNDAPGTEIRQILDAARAAFDESLIRARRADSLRSLSEGLRWNVVDTNLHLATQALTTLARRYDEHVLATHASDPALVQALARVTGLRRADLLQDLLTPPAGGPRSDAALSERLGRSQLKLITFAEAAQVLPANDPAQLAEQVRQTLTPPVAADQTRGAIQSGSGTNLTAALQTLAQQETGHAAAAIFLTDGRHNAPGDPTESARLLAARSLHIHTLLVGSEQVAPDAAADPPDAPEWVFKDDTVKITARIHLDGLAGQKVAVELLRDGKTLAQKSLLAHSNQESQALDFADKPGVPGVYSYQIRIPRVAQEANVLNNQQMFHVRVKKDKLAVLLVEEQPRWEYQFLASSLARDPSLKLQTVLFAPAGIQNVAPPLEVARTRASPQNPRRDAGLLPDTLEQWQAFDVIILGDLPPERLPPAQQQNLTLAVRDRGTTLVFIAGRNAMPQGYLTGEGADATPLSNLLPIDATPAWTPAQLTSHLDGGFRPAISPEAGVGGGGGGILAQLHSDPQIAAQLAGQLPPWFFHSAYTRARPASQVLWYIAEPESANLANRGASASVAESFPLVRQHALLSTMSLGLGRTVYLASDQTWRLHNVAGHDLANRFWSQLIRWSAGNDLPAGGRFVRFGASASQTVSGEPVTIIARILQEDLTPLQGEHFTAQATLLADKEAPKLIDSTPFVPQPDAPGYYRATVGSLPPGTIEIALQGGTVERLLNTDPTATPKTLRLQVAPRLDVEDRDTNTNPALLVAVAQAGGGISLPFTAARILAESLPVQQETHTSLETLGLFTDPKSPYTRAAHLIFLALFTLILLAEWLLRKHAGLV